MVSFCQNISWTTRSCNKEEEMGQILGAEGDDLAARTAPRVDADLMRRPNSGARRDAEFYGASQPEKRSLSHFIQG